MRKLLDQLPHAQDANILKMYLKSFDIDCEISDDGIVGAHPLMSIAVGGVKIWVDEDQLVRAQELLVEFRANKYQINEDAEEGIEELDADFSIPENERANKSAMKALFECNKCGELKMVARNIFWRNAFGLFGLPIFFFIHVLYGPIIWLILLLIIGKLPMGYKCRNCGNIED